MRSRLLQLALLGAAAIATGAIVGASQDGPTATPTAQDGGDGPAAKGDEKKKETKDGKITVWTLHAEGKG